MYCRRKWNKTCHIQLNFAVMCSRFEGDKLDLSFFYSSYPDSTMKELLELAPFANVVVKIKVTPVY